MQAVWQWVKDNVVVLVLSASVVVLVWLLMRTDNDAVAEKLRERADALRDKYAGLEERKEELEGFHSDKAKEFREKRQDMEAIIDNIDAVKAEQEAEAREREITLEKRLAAIREAKEGDFEFPEYDARN